MPAVEQKDIAVPEFYMHPVENKAKSEAEGRPIFEEKEMVRIRVPGDRNMTWEGEVTDTHRNRFPKQYDAFQRGEKVALEGTPLEMWPQMTRTRVAELKACNVFTVEELADVTDGQLDKLGAGSREEREKARAFINVAKDSADVESMAAEIARLSEMVERLSGNAAPLSPKEKDISECTDAELKAYIKRETGEGVRGNPSRDTLLSRAREVAEGGKVAA